MYNSNFNVFKIKRKLVFRLAVVRVSVCGIFFDSGFCKNVSISICLFAECSCQ
jgi:hypothetical protein